MLSQFGMSDFSHSLRKALPARRSAWGVNEGEGEGEGKRGETGVVMQNEKNK